jgi:S-formylglutathione hydrolase FrmB
MYKIFISGALILFTGAVFGQAKSFVDSIFSRSLGRMMPVSITIPSSYDGQKPMPIMYLLHGHSAHHANFLRTSDIEQYVEESSVLCVMPEGGNSWYINSYSESDDRFEDYLMKDLPEFIQKKFNVDTIRQYIAGYSMGGYGALVLALRNPGRFAFAASLSGAVMYPGDTEILEENSKYKFAKPSTDQAFGELPNVFREEHDPFFLYKETPPEELPYIFFITGLQDYFPEIMRAQRALSDSLNTYGALHEYHEIQGGHDNRNQDAALHLLLQRIEYLRDKGFKSLVKELSVKGNAGITEDILIRIRLLKKNFSDIYYLNMFEMNTLGYTLMEENRLEDAVKVFKLNIEFFPNSAFCYDSMSDGYIKSAENDLAIGCMEKALVLLPNDTDLSDAYKIKFEEIIQNKLKEIKKLQE